MELNEFLANYLGKSEVSEIEQHGVVGMKWGVRKSKPASSRKSKGSLKDALVKRINASTRAKSNRERKKAKAIAEAKAKGKTETSALTSAELRDKVERLRLNKEYASYTQNRKTKLKDTLERAFFSSVETSAKTIGTSVMSHYGKKVVTSVIKDPAFESIFRSTLNKAKQEQSGKSTKEKSND